MICSEFDFKQLLLFKNEFEDLTSPQSGEEQYQNIMKLLGLSKEDLNMVMKVATEYISPHEMKFHELRAMFATGFLLAMYSLKDKQCSCLH